MKKFFLIATLFSLGWVVLLVSARFVNMVPASIHTIEQQTMTLKVDLQLMMVLLLYIAWRVTPSTKS